MRKDLKYMLLDAGKATEHKSAGKSIRGRKLNEKLHIRDDEDTPSSLPMRPIWTEKCYTYPSDDLGPLYRWLQKQSGRPWSKIWKEVCEAADNRSLQGYHLRDHVKSAVHFADKIESYPYYYFNNGGPEYEVDANGIFHYNQKKYHKNNKEQIADKKRAEAETKKWVWPDEPDIWLEKFDGIWYEVRKTVIVRTTFFIEGGYRNYEEPVEKKRQLSKKELRAYNLNNDSIAA